MAINVASNHQTSAPSAATATSSPSIHTGQQQVMTTVLKGAAGTPVDSASLWYSSVPVMSGNIVCHHHHHHHHHHLYHHLANGSGSGAGGTMAANLTCCVPFASTGGGPVMVQNNSSSTVTTPNNHSGGSSSSSLVLIHMAQQNVPSNLAMNRSLVEGTAPVPVPPPPLLVAKQLHGASSLAPLNPTLLSQMLSSTMVAPMSNVSPSFGMVSSQSRSVGAITTQSVMCVDNAAIRKLNESNLGTSTCSLSTSTSLCSSSSSSSLSLSPASSHFASVYSSSSGAVTPSESSSPSSSMPSSVSPESGSTGAVWSSLSSSTYTTNTTSSSSATCLSSSSSPSPPPSPSTSPSTVLPPPCSTSDVSVGQSTTDKLDKSFTTGSKMPVKRGGKYSSVGPGGSVAADVATLVPMSQQAPIPPPTPQRVTTATCCGVCFNCQPQARPTYQTFIPAYTLCSDGSILAPTVPVAGVYSSPPTIATVPGVTSLQMASHLIPPPPAPPVPAQVGQPALVHPPPPLQPPTQQLPNNGMSMREFYAQYGVYYIPVPWNQSYGMERVWMSEFSRIFSNFYNEMWSIQPVDKKPRGVRLQMFVDSAKVRFCCDKCAHSWTSMKGRIVFWFNLLSPNFNMGFVAIKLFGQKCELCKLDVYEQPMWYPEEVSKVLMNLYNRVGQIFYGFEKTKFEKQRRMGKPRTPHNKYLCQACLEGVCLSRRRSSQCTKLPHCQDGVEHGKDSQLEDDDEEYNEDEVEKNYDPDDHEDDDEEQEKGEQVVNIKKLFEPNEQTNDGGGGESKTSKLLLNDHDDEGHQSEDSGIVESETRSDTSVDEHKSQ